MSALDTLLSRLEHVRESGDGQWMAKCPGHQDKTPSLSIKEAGDGTILLHDFGGCDSADVLAAVGLELKDLFPHPLNHHKRPVPLRQRWDHRALLRQLRAECGVVALAASDLDRSNPVTGADRERLREAISRISSIAEVADGN